MKTKHKYIFIIQKYNKIITIHIQFKYLIQKINIIN